MASEQRVADHYNHGELLAAIEAGLTRLGLSPETTSIEDLAPVDEFHVGGRKASSHFLDQLAIQPGMRILDIGCGLGGAARFAATTYDAHVVGIDLTPEFIAAGTALCRWVGLDDRVTLHQGSALDMPFADQTFDGAYMMHVGMNIAAKPDLFAEAHRVLAPGARFGVYDIMRTGDGNLAYPVPWAASPDTSWVATPDSYKAALEQAGFRIVAELDRREFALDYFRTVRETNKAQGGPPPLGLHTLMQHSTAEKTGNLVANITNGLVAPVELITVRE